MKLTVVLPSYNEAANLPVLLTRISEVLSRAGINFRIVVVDDGSTDETLTLARKAAETMPIIVLQHETNVGLGGAIRTGIREAVTWDGVAVFMDADNSHDPRLIIEMLQKIELGNDVVIASRFQPGGKQVGVPHYRRFLSSTFSAMLRTIVRYENVTDYSSGFRAYRVSALRALTEKHGAGVIEETGFACMLELLLKLQQIRARVAEVPLLLRYDLKLGKSKMRVVRAIFQNTKVVCRSCLPRVSRDKRIDWPELVKFRDVANS